MLKVVFTIFAVLLSGCIFSGNEEAGSPATPLNEDGTFLGECSFTKISSGSVLWVRES